MPSSNHQKPGEAATGSLISRKKDKQLEPPKITSALDSQLTENQDELAKDMLDGMTELLNMHNSDEMRILCESLNVENFFENSKADNINYILNELIGLAHQDERTEVEISAAYNKVLRTVWDGIIIEYLRNIGKNLMRCKDNLRGAVLTHWRRHAVVKVTMNADGDPVFVQKHSKEDTFQIPDLPESINREQLEQAVSDLKDLWEEEQLLKLAERRVRENSDFQSIVDFLAHVAKIRGMEDKLRLNVWSVMQLSVAKQFESEQASLRHRQQVLEATQALERAKAEFKLRERQARLKEYMNDQRVLEVVKYRLRVAKLERDRSAQEASARRERKKHEQVVAGKDEVIRDLEERLDKTLTDKAHWKATAQERKGELESTLKKLWAGEERFEKQAQVLDRYVGEHTALLSQVVNQESISDTYFSIAQSKSHGLHLLQDEYERICQQLITTQEEMDTQQSENREEIQRMEFEISTLHTKIHSLEHRLVTGAGDDSEAQKSASEDEDGLSVATERTKGGTKAKQSKRKSKKKKQQKSKGKKTKSVKDIKDVSDSVSVASNRPKSKRSRTRSKKK